MELNETASASVVTFREAAAGARKSNSIYEKIDGIESHH
jgi:hypothetical protein